MKTVGYIPMLPGDSTDYYRISGVLPYIKHPHINFKTLRDIISIDWNNLTGLDILIVQRPLNEAGLRLIDIAKGMNIKVILDYDDDVFNLPSHNPAYEIYESNKEIIKDCISMSDEVWVSTIGVKNSGIYNYNNNIHIIPNAHNDFIFPVELKRPFNRDTKLAVYRGGMTHNEDVYTQQEGIVKKINENEDWEFRFIGSRFHAIEVLTGKNHTYTNPMPLMSYFNYLYDSNPNLMFFPLITNQFNHAKCLTGDTIIFTSQGFKKISEIKKGDMIWQESKYVLVNDIYSYDDKEVYEVKTQMGYSIKGTLNHKLRSNGIFKTITDLKEGDMLDISFMENNIKKYVTIPVGLWRAHGLKKANKFSYKSPMLPVITINKRWGRFIGYMLGDGTLTGKNRIGISCDSLYEDVVEDVLNIANELGLETTIVKKKYKQSEARGVDIYINSSSLRHFLAEVIGFVGSKGKTLKVPDCIFQSPLIVVREFIRGCFETDGTVSKQGCSFTTKQEQLAKEMQVLLLQFSIKSKIRVYYNKIYKKNYYTIDLAREASDVFYKKIGFISKIKQQKLKVICSKKHSNAYKSWNSNDFIKSIKFHGSEKVYDLNIPEKNYYCANGIISHNSNISWLEATYAGAAFYGNKELNEFRRQDLTLPMSEFYQPQDMDILEFYNQTSWDYIQENLLLSKINQLRINRLL